MRRFCLGLPILLSAGGAYADPAAIVPPDPWQVIHAARAVGEAAVGRDGMKDPVITVTAEGLTWQIVFYGCWMGRDCKSILFQATLTTPDWAETPVDPGLLVAWNRSKLFGRASAGDSGTLSLDHAVAMTAGLPRATLDGIVTAWMTALTEFSEHVDFPKEINESNAATEGS